MDIDDEKYLLRLIFAEDVESKSRCIEIDLYLDVQLRVKRSPISHRIGDEKIMIDWNQNTKSFGFDQKTVHLVMVRLFISDPYDPLTETFDYWRETRWRETGSERVKEESGSLLDRVRTALNTTETLSPLKGVRGTIQKIALIIDKFSLFSTDTRRRSHPETYTIILDTEIAIGDDNVAESISFSRCRFMHIEVDSERKSSKEARTNCKSDSNCVLFRKI